MKRIAGAIVVLFCVCIGFAADTKSTEWPTYGHDPGGMRFSPLKQITPANVARLQRAWVYHMKPSDASPFAGSSSTPLVVNVWGFLTVDVDRGVVYMPFGAPANDR